MWKNGSRDFLFSFEGPWMKKSNVSSQPTNRITIYYPGNNISLFAWLRLFSCVRLERRQLHLQRGDVSHAEKQPHQTAHRGGPWRGNQRPGGDHTQEDGERMDAGLPSDFYTFLHMISAPPPQTLKLLNLEFQSKQSTFIIYFCRTKTMMADYLLLTLKRQ